MIDMRKENRRYLVESINRFGLDGESWSSGKCYRSILFEYNLTHPENPIRVGELGSPTLVLRDIRSG